MSKLAVALAFLALNFYTYHYMATSETHPPRATFATFPLELDEWACVQRERMTEDVEDTLQVTDYLVCHYSRLEPRDVVSVYIGYHESQVRRSGGGRSSVIHPPKHCLPGAGWDIIDAAIVPMDLPGLPERPARVNRLVIAKGQARQIVYYWYQSRGHVIAEDWMKTLRQFWDRATRQRTDGALVRFTVPVIRDDEERADAAFMDFVRVAAPLLPAYLPE